MIYLINICSERESVISAKCSKEEGAEHLTKELKAIGIDVYRVGWICYWLQKHNFYKLAAVLSPMSKS